MRATAFLVLLFACKSPAHSPVGDDDDDVDAPVVGDDASVTDDAATDATPDTPPQQKVIRTIFVIPMENKASSQIYGNTDDAPYINELMGTIAAHATKFGDALPSLPSEPHYVWMEAGTNAFADKTFTSDSDASSSNSTASTSHLVTQLTAAGIPWMSYQEGIAANTCPISSTGHYKAKHNPFVFFQDVAGSPPSSSTPGCIQHHRPYSSFVGDLNSGITGFVFITPDECHDMHGAFSCPSGLSDSSNIRAGDTWLSQELPRIITYTQQHDDAVIFITWDEGDSSNVIPFLAIGNYVKAGTTSTVTYSHSSLLESIEKLLGVPVLPTVETANHFADMFETGVFE